MLFLIIVFNGSDDRMNFIIGIGVKNCFLFCLMFWFKKFLNILFKNWFWEFDFSFIFWNVLMIFNNIFVFWKNNFLLCILINVKLLFVKNFNFLKYFFIVFLVELGLFLNSLKVWFIDVLFIYVMFLLRNFFIFDW